MEIALFTDGVSAIIGKRAEDGKIDYLSTEAESLFQDPDLLYERLINFLKRKLFIQDVTLIRKFHFALPGYINSKTGVIDLSINLDDLALVKSYRGYSIKNTFGKLVGNENVYVINDAIAIGLGVYNTRKDFRPSLIFLISRGVGVSIIDSFGDIHSTELGSWFILNHLKAVTFLIDKKKIEDLIADGSDDIYRDYTTIFIDVIKHFRGKTNKVLSLATKKATQWALSIYNKLPNENQNLKNFLIQIPSEKIFIWSAIEEYLAKEMLIHAGFGDILHYPQNEDEKLKIPITGCFEYQNYLDREKPAIELIEYWAMNESMRSRLS